MKLTWRQFHVYLDAFTWVLQEQTDDGRLKNQTWDLQLTRNDPRIKNWKQQEIERANKALAKIRKRQVQ